MELIDKDALVAKIKELIRKNESYLDENASDPIRFQKAGAYSVLVYLQHFIDTLKVKEVDLEKEFYDFLDTLIGKDNGHLSEDELFSIAEYFFDLGLKAKGAEGICKISETNCPNFDEAQGTNFVRK